MSCNSNESSQNKTNNGIGYIIIIVLYILLAIMLGTYIAY